MNRINNWLRHLTWRHAQSWGLAGSVTLALCSYAVGATRARGGIMQELGLTALTFGHSAGILMVAMWLAIAAFVLSWAVAGGHILRHGVTLDRRLLASWITPLVFAGPMMSRDIYSYLMQGTLARDGMDAYQVGAAANPGPLLFEVSADWRNTTTPYGPAHLWLGKTITSITGDSVTAGLIAFKVISVASFLLLLWAIAQLSPHFGVRPSVAAWLGVANPLVMIHLLGGMHTEVIFMAGVACAFLLVLRLRPWLGLLAASTLVALGLALKATAAIALPFIVWIFVCRQAGTGTGHWWRDTRQRWTALLTGGLVSLALTIAIMAAITALSGQTWGWIAEMAGNTKVINPLALPSLIASSLAPPLSFINEDLTFNVLVVFLRPWSAALMLLGLVAVWWLFRHNPRTAIQGATLAYAITCIFNSVTLPWYYAAPLALAGAWMLDRRGVFAIAWASMSLCFMFDGGGNNRLYVLWWVIAISAAMWVMARACFGYAPGRPAAYTDPWHIALKTTPSPAPAAAPHEPNAHAEHQSADQAKNHPG